ncbi:MAG: hypothetical protein ACFFFH_15905 [Candidatus Thorarchaeota archaeon]
MQFYKYFSWILIIIGIGSVSIAFLGNVFLQTTLFEFDFKNRDTSELFYLEKGNFYQIVIIRKEYTRGYVHGDLMCYLINGHVEEDYSVRAFFEGESGDCLLIGSFTAKFSGIHYLYFKESHVDVWPADTYIQIKESRIHSFLRINDLLLTFIGVFIIAIGILLQVIFRYWYFRMKVSSKVL